MVDEATAEKIKEHYLKGQGSIQDIARIYRVDVSVVLDIIGAPQLKTVETQGDLIDPSEAGPGAAMNYGKTYQVPYDVS